MPRVGGGSGDIGAVEIQDGEAVVVNSLNATSNDAGLTVFGTVNSTGSPVIVEQDSAGNYVRRNLGTEIGAPSAITDVLTWVDPKDGLFYGAYTSSFQLVVLTRSADGVWAFDDITSGLTSGRGGGIPVAVIPTTAITQFVSAEATGSRVGIAGITANGGMVAFEQQQDGRYSFRNISTDLALGGFATPQLTDLISYRTSWDSWHLAGIDPSGDIISVWISPSTFTQWRLDNLSDVTGAPPLAGGLNAILTSWDGINLTGLDAAGNVRVTWWVPSFGGDWQSNNLTQENNGVPLTGGSLTGYYTSWDGMNYAGLDADGNLMAYWWVPSFGGEWRITPIAEASSSAQLPVTRLESHVSSTGTLNVMGIASDGSAIRSFWQPGGENIWDVDNLTSLADIS